MYNPVKTAELLVTSKQRYPKPLGHMVCFVHVVWCVTWHAKNASTCQLFMHKCRFYTCDFQWGKYATKNTHETHYKCAYITHIFMHFFTHIFRTLFLPFESSLKNTLLRKAFCKYQIKESSNIMWTSALWWLLDHV